ncbi:hypothetical protein SAMN02982989_3404 [Xaviernesmea oryzae]|uniref:Uncharacterized protein n=1 Tax=Xaviernesmea oryzae TaxID=464029 RepID=A0A1X7G8G5_9HYPH|nr:hypothetical protein [Xaviernesmea oryzae]SMF65785.1 hypothetical protein SAMN02982989_3404 [Xaviernesmea oryzae]
MASFIASYDLNDKNDPHDEYLAAAEKCGWYPWILASDDKWYRLPNTTLKGEFDTKDAAVAAFKSIKGIAEKSLGKSITVEKWIVVQYTTATFNSDETQSS